MLKGTVQSAIIAVLMVIINPLVIIIMKNHVQKMQIENLRYKHKSLITYQTNWFVHSWQSNIESSK